MSAFTGIWCGLHLQIAQLSGNPELALTEADGKQWLLALQNVMRHYSIEASQKAVDWAAFAGVTSFIYVPRFAAIQLRKRRPTRQSGFASNGGLPGAVVYPFTAQSPASSNGTGAPTTEPQPAPAVEPEFAADDPIGGAEPA